jgi:hypothetical protein
MKTHHADDETLEYIASLEQRNAELVELLDECIKFVDFCVLQALAPSPDADIKVTNYSEDHKQAKGLSEKLKVALAKTKE